MDTTDSSAPHAHPSIEDHDDTLEAHYACLERPCACYSGWVFVGYIDKDGEESEASYRCRRCADSRWPHPDKPCNYHQRGALPASTSDSGVGLTQLFNHYFEEEKNDGAKDHHDHRGARASAKMCRVGLATLWFATLFGICGLVLVRFLLGDATLDPHEK